MLTKGHAAVKAVECGEVILILDKYTHIARAWAGLVCATNCAERIYVGTIPSDWLVGDRRHSRSGGAIVAARLARTLGL